MQVLCIHVYGKQVTPNVPLTVQVGGVYNAIREGRTDKGFEFYELQHQPGVGYDKKCFVPLDPTIDDVENESLKEKPTLISYDTNSKRRSKWPLSWHVFAKGWRPIQALRGKSKPRNVGKRYHFQLEDSIGRTLEKRQRSYKP